MNTTDFPKTGIDLVPDTVNQSPDYFCTWQVQLYHCNNKGPQGQRDCMTEHCIFGTGDEAADRRDGIGWADHLYKDARRDLIFLMDDCWDVPIGGKINESPYYASQLLAPDKFPAATADGTLENREAMKRLSDAVKAKGWKGLGGWICIEHSSLFPDQSDEAYWTERLKWADYAGWLYWKIDWGKECRKWDTRKLITELRFLHAPHLFAEQAMLPDLIPYADSFRTYDVFTLLAIPITLEKLAVDLAYDAAPGHLGYINCMDEVYTAAALGCAIDVTRHDMRGPLPDGRPDPSFPALHRNLKTKTDEVTRTVRWHRIAPAFSCNGSETFIDEHRMTDNWDVVEQAREIEAWWKYKDGDHIERSGPARISRGLTPPTAEPDAEGLVPYLISALHPCGAASVATLARTLGRRFFTPLCRVEQDVGDASLIGIFGYYGSLVLRSRAVRPDSRILMQDLLLTEALDVTDACEITDGCVMIPGELISHIGQMGNHEGDTSEPGLVLKIENR